MKLNWLRLIWTMLTQFFRPRQIPIPVPSPIQPPVSVPSSVAISVPSSVAIQPPVSVPSPVAIRPPVPVPSPVAIQPSFDQPTFLPTSIAIQPSSLLPTSKVNPSVPLSNLPITIVAVQPSFAQPTLLPTSKVKPSIPLSNLPITIVTPSPSGVSRITIVPITLPPISSPVAIQPPVPVPNPVAIQLPVPIPNPVAMQPQMTICTQKNDIFHYRDTNSTSSTSFVVGKKGFGISLRSIENAAKLLSLDVYWNYAWTLNRSIYQPSIPMFIPMAWGGRRNLSDFEQSVLNIPNLQSFIDNGTIQYLMGFNEPDERTQSNVTVEAAIEYWPVLEKFNIPLISPSCANPSGEWMTEFMKIANQRCYRIDYIGIHWYGAPNPSSFTNAMTRFYNMYQLPLVVTEFSPADWLATTINNNRLSQTQILIFMKQVLLWLENTPWIAGYNWFNWNITNPNGGPSALFDENGTLTKLGLYYKSVRNDNIMGNQSIV